MIKLFVLIFPAFILGQNYSFEPSTINVNQNGINFNFPFAGGFNNLEFQFIDIDNDGDKDLFYLNSDNSFGYLKNIGSSTNPFFTPSTFNFGELKFIDWFFFCDIDNDGDFDCFSGRGNALISFFRNTGTQSNPFFLKEIDILLDSDGNMIFSESGSNPVFADVDGDGDLDFITGNSIGSLSFFRNVGTPQDFSFSFITSTWLDILIISSKPETNSSKIDGPRHGASAIEFADLDADGDLDMLWGDFFSPSLYYLQNTGTPTDPAYKVITNRYPQNTDSLITSGFNMPRLTDINGNGKLDLFVSVLYDPTVKQSLILYENLGTINSPDFRKVTDDFLFTFDAGIQSVPAFVDIDNDGDFDLFVGNGQNPEGSIYFLKNTGNNFSPSFTIENTIFSGISGELSLAPAFGDIDGDGDFDLFVGEFDGRIKLYTNIGTINSPVFSEGVYISDINSTQIDVGLYARPFLFDFDGDGDLDLFSGAFNGRFFFYENIGNLNNFSFQRKDSFFGTLDIGDNSSLFILDFDSDGINDMIAGSRNGDLIRIKNSGDNVVPVWSILDTLELGINHGAESVPFLVDIDSDGDLDIFSGSVKGGVYFFRNQEISSVSDEKFNNSETLTIKVFPNPFTEELNIIVENAVNETKIEFFSLIGEKLFDIHNNNLFKNELYLKIKKTQMSFYSSGIYYIVVTSPGKQVTQKIIYFK